MQISYKKILLYISVLCIGINSSYIIFKEFFSAPQIVYVDSSMLFDSFNMTKELKKEGEKQFTTQKKKIDSLYFKIQNSAAKEQPLLMKEYVGLKENLEQFNQQFAMEQSSKIWKRLQTYIEAFSKENNYKLLIGSDQKQMVLYADANSDVTNKLINYANSKYEGLQ